MRLEGHDMATPIPALQIGAEHSVLLHVDGPSAILRVSPIALAARHWPSGRPSPVALERAIDDVENAIEQAGLHHANRNALEATAGLIQALPPRFRSSPELSRDEVEAEFARLVAASEGAGLDASSAPRDEAAAALLLLREVMHHLGFQIVRTGL
jgi:hypothetical protein